MHELRTEPRQRRSQQSIESILDAAERLIHEQGQVSFTAQELATYAEMSIGRVYYWFPDLPAVVNALAERAVKRLIDGFAVALAGQEAAATQLLVKRVIGVLCDVVDLAPGTVALCLSGGEASYGAALQGQLEGLVAAAVSRRVPDAPEAETALVARTAVGITLGMLSGYAQNPDERPLIRQELVYVLSAWLYCRYPSPNDPVWGNPTAQIQPSRRPATEMIRETEPVYPAIVAAYPVV